jgi:hypothetical protein
MKQVQTVEDVYPAIEELIVALETGNQSKLAAILHHRMHQVAWTTRTELFEELQNVFTKALQSETVSLSESVKTQLQRILQLIDGYLKQSTE